MMPLGSESHLGQSIDERMISSVFEFARDGMLITDTNLEAPGPTIVAANPAFCEITGYRPEEVIGQTPRLLQGERTDRKVVGGIRSVLEAGKTFRGETYNYRKNGDEFLMSWYIVPLRNSEDRVTHYLGVQRDVTEERRMEAAAQTARAMDNLSWVFAGVRHELGNPVNNLRSVLKLLLEHFDELDTEACKRYLHDASREVNRMGYLLGALRSFSIHDQVEARAVALEPILEDLLKLVDISAAEVGVVVGLEKRDSATPEHNVMGDARALHQVLINLVSNALEALGDRPDPSVVVRYGWHRYFAKIEVVDNGVGISEADFAMLFQPFRTTKARGTGLGLVLSKKLVTSMGGDLEISSRQGFGTTATIRLPLAVEGASLMTLGAV